MAFICNGLAVTTLWLGTLGGCADCGASGGSTSRHSLAGSIGFGIAIFESERPRAQEGSRQSAESGKTLGRFHGRDANLIDFVARV
jgi:hypothetical protein